MLLGSMGVRTVRSQKLQDLVRLHLGRLYLGMVLMYYHLVAKMDGRSWSLVEGLTRATL